LRISLARRSSRFSRSRGLQTLTLIAGHAGPQAVIGLGPPHPVAQRLVRDAELGRDGADRAHASGAHPGARTPCARPARAAPAGTSPVWPWLQPLTSRSLQESQGGSETTHASGCQRLTTNQEMELRAILEALRAHPGQPIVILTDSQYAIDCVTSWLPRWRRNGWRTSARRPVKHQPTIEAIAAELDRRPVQLVKVPGHAGHPLMSVPTGSRPPRQPCGHSAVGMDGDRGLSQPAGIFKAADCPHRRGVCSPGFRTSERTGPIE